MIRNSYVRNIFFSLAKCLLAHSEVEGLINSMSTEPGGVAGFKSFTTQPSEGQNQRFYINSWVVV